MWNDWELKCHPPHPPPHPPRVMCFSFHLYQPHLWKDPLSFLHPCLLSWESFGVSLRLGRMCVCRCMCVCVCHPHPVPLGSSHSTNFGESQRSRWVLSVRAAHNAEPYVSQAASLFAAVTQPLRVTRSSHVGGQLWGLPPGDGGKQWWANAGMPQPKAATVAICHPDTQLLF